MEYISAEEFLKQPKEVQKVFLDWWKKNANEFDLIGYIGKCKAYQNSFPSLVRNVAIDCFELMVEIIPLFTEGQLRQFIEDKTGTKILNVNLNEFEVGEKILKRYCIHLDNFRIFMNQSEELLQSYWSVAMQIAKEGVNDGF